jgi:hypothetical protein
MHIFLKADLVLGIYDAGMFWCKLFQLGIPYVKWGFYGKIIGKPSENGAFTLSQTYEKRMEKSPLVLDKSTISMAMFNSYVSVPEGSSSKLT